MDWSAAIGRLQQANVRWLLLGAAVVLLGLLIRAARWGLLLHSLDLRPVKLRVLQAYLSGQALNVLLPFRGGEAVRLGMISANQPQGAPEAAVSIVTEKGLDALALMVLIGVLFLSLPGERAGEAMRLLLPALGSLVLILALLLLLGLYLWPRLRSWLADRMGGRLRGVIPRFDRVVLRWRAWLLTPRRAIPALTLTALNWLVMLATNLILFRAVGLPLGGLAAGLVLALIMVGLLPALMPANIGPFHFFALLALQPFDVPADVGIAFAILLHAVVTLPTLLFAGSMLLLPGLRRTALLGLPEA